MIRMIFALVRRLAAACAGDPALVIDLNIQPRRILRPLGPRAGLDHPMGQTGRQIKLANIAPDNGAIFRPAYRWQRRGRPSAGRKYDDGQEGGKDTHTPSQTRAPPQVNRSGAIVSGAVRERAWRVWLRLPDGAVAKGGSFSEQRDDSSR